MKTLSHSATGFSLISALFLLIVIAALGLFAVTISSVQHQTSAMDVMGDRAYQVAKAGLEWGSFQITQSAIAGTAFLNACQAAPISQAVTMPSGTQLSSFSVNLECTASSHLDGSTTLWIYQLTATATLTGASVGALNYVERQLSVSLAQ